jgi:hypothetical protein
MKIESNTKKMTKCLNEIRKDIGDEAMFSVLINYIVAEAPTFPGCLGDWYDVTDAIGEAIGED